MKRNEKKEMLRRRTGEDAKKREEMRSKIMQKHSQSQILAATTLIQVMTAKWDIFSADFPPKLGGERT